MLVRNFLCCILWPLPLVLSPHTTEKRLAKSLCLLHLREDAPGPVSSLWPSAGLFPGDPCLFCTGELRTGHSTPGSLGLLGHEGTLLAHGQPVVHQDPQVLLLRAPLQQVIPQPVLICPVVPSQVQDSTLALIKPHLVSSCPSLQLVQVLLNGRAAFWHIGHSSQLCIIGVLAEGRHYSLIKVVDEDVEQDRTQHRPLGNTASHRSPARLCATDHHPLSLASQPVLNSPYCPLLYPTLSQLC
ncbi:uncharacterized protein LOC118250829 [Cygnus atratus]|uniref:uncharacterized protein LOC118250829 n=1 Tax=Cygnus atratus TaxID=8868 RepID=UPI0021B7A6A6|nr:uncharacterized protein LOC118250829 [Cygnus atratus]